MRVGEQDDGKIHGRTLYLAWASIASFTVFAVGAGFYWALTRTNMLRCVYGDAICSLTVGTYLLALVTGTAFLAAYRAARFAARALAHEQRSAIVIQGCRDEHRAAVEMFVRPEDRALTYIRPWKSDEERSFKPHDFEVVSIGRSPVVDAVVPVVVQIADDLGNPTNDAHLGSMRADGNRHIRIWVPEGFGDVVVQWVYKKATHGDGEPLECHAERAFPFAVVYVKQFDELHPEGTELQVRRELPEKPRRSSSAVPSAADLDDSSGVSTDPARAVEATGAEVADARGGPAGATGSAPAPFAAAPAAGEGQNPIASDVAPADVAAAPGQREEARPPRSAARDEARGADQGDASGTSSTERVAKATQPTSGERGAAEVTEPGRAPGAADDDDPPQAKP